MAKIHMKGFILRLLHEHAEGLWDHEIMRRVLDEYRHRGSYWKGEVRVTLADLFSGALIEELEDALDNGEHFAAGKVLIKFRLTSFGRERMLDTGLL